MYLAFVVLYELNPGIRVFSSNLLSVTPHLWRHVRKKRWGYLYIIQFNRICTVSNVCLAGQSLYFHCIIRFLYTFNIIVKGSAMIGNVYLGWRVKYSWMAQPKRVVLDRSLLRRRGVQYSARYSASCLFTEANKNILCCVSGESPSFPNHPP